MTGADSGCCFRARVSRPLDEERAQYIQDACVTVDAAGRIRELRPWADGDPDSALDLRRDGVLTPGYVDTHLHFPQTRRMGQASGPLLKWLETSIFPEEARFADPTYAATVAREFVRAQLDAGTTDSLIYGSVHAEACGQLFEELSVSGLRAIAGPALMERDAPAQLCRGLTESLAGLDALRETWHEAQGGRLRLGVLPRFALSCDAELLMGAGDYAREHGLFVSTHLAETEKEYQLVCERFGSADYLGVYERFDLIHARTVLAHCIHLSAAEWKRVGDHKAVVSHCPDSNDFLGSGAMPTSEVLLPGRRVGLGSDVAAGRGFTMATHAAAAYDNALRVSSPLSPERLFWWLTAGGSTVLGNPEAGTLAEGSWADMALRPVPVGVTEPAAVLGALIFDPACAGASRVWVAGERCRRPQD